MAERLDDYGPDYPFLTQTQAAWSRPGFRLLCLTRSYLNFVHHLGVKPGDKVLSVGSGFGQNEWLMRELFGLDILSADFNYAALEAAQKLLPNYPKLVCVDARALSFSESAFDFVVSQDLLEHLPSEEAAQTAFTEMERVLKPGGKMFHKITVVGDEGLDLDPTHHIKWTADQWVNWFQRQGWCNYRDTSELVPFWSRKRVGLELIRGSFYLKKESEEFSQV